jgi:hypothetical protein
VNRDSGHKSLILTSHHRLRRPPGTATVRTLARMRSTGFPRPSGAGRRSRLRGSQVGDAPAGAADRQFALGPTRTMASRTPVHRQLGVPARRWRWWSRKRRQSVDHLHSWTRRGARAAESDSLLTSLRPFATSCRW